MSKSVVKAIVSSVKLNPDREMRASICKSTKNCEALGNLPLFYL